MSNCPHCGQNKLIFDPETETNYCPNCCYEIEVEPGNIEQQTSP